MCAWRVRTGEPGQTLQHLQAPPGGRWISLHLTAAHSHYFFRHRSLPPPASCLTPPSCRGPSTSAQCGNRGGIMGEPSLLEECFPFFLRIITLDL